MPQLSAVTGQIVNRAELAGFLAVSPMQIDTMVRAGCPIISRGGSGKPSQFNTADVVKWLRDREAASVRAEVDPAKGQTEESKRRFTAAAAELKEIQLAEKRKLMISIEDVAPILEDELANVRSRLLAMPGRLAPGLVGLLDPAAIEAKILDEVTAALNELTSDAGRATL
jgi:phage terminase Nu1 subunit (DNA packaging protein)